MAPVIGIDLGTTNSCAAFVKDGVVTMIPARNGATIVPSILSVDEKGNLCIGQQAKRRFVTNPENTIYGAKRLMGRSFGSDEMADIQKNFYYHIEASETGEAEILVEDKVFTLVEISALILEELKEQAQEYFEERIEKAVISVPAYFTNSQRDAVRKAAVRAGFDVLRIINEPTAAALSYGFGKKTNERILVFDLGGGTFDVTALHLYEEVYEVIATGGDSFLGGIDFDNKLVEHLVAFFKKDQGIDLSGDPVALQRIRDAAEKAKIDLSSATTATVNLPFITMRDGTPVTLATELTRDEYNDLIEPLVLQTIRITEKVLLEAKITKEEVDDIILVGGMTRLPLVQEYVSRYFGKKPRKDVHPDEVVAQGAAILAHSLSSGSSGVVLKDVLPVSIGMGAGGQFRKLINKNTTLPTKLVKRFATTQDDQSAVRLMIYQGESRDCANNEFVGELVLDGLSAKPAGQAEVLVAFVVDQEGILKIRAKERGTDAVVKADFKTMTVIQRESYRADQVLDQETQKATAAASETAENAEPGDETVDVAPESPPTLTKDAPKEQKTKVSRKKSSASPKKAKKSWWRRLFGL